MQTWATRLTSTHHWQCTLQSLLYSCRLVLSCPALLLEERTRNTLLSKPAGSAVLHAQPQPLLTTPLQDRSQTTRNLDSQARGVQTVQRIMRGQGTGGGAVRTCQPSCTEGAAAAEALPVRRPVAEQECAHGGRPMGLHRAAPEKETEGVSRATREQHQEEGNGEGRPGPFTDSRAGQRVQT